MKETQINTNYWMELYWPKPNRHPDDLSMWFHEKKVNKNAQVLEGDKVLFYEVKKHPDSDFVGSQTVFASGTAERDAEKIPQDEQWDGEKKWILRRSVSRNFFVPPKFGIPLKKVLKLLGKKKLPQTGFKMGKDDFLRIENELKECSKNFNAQHAMNGGTVCKKAPTLFVIIKPKYLAEAIKYFHEGHKQLYFSTDAHIGKAASLPIQHVYFKESGSSAITYVADFIGLATVNPKQYRLPSYKEEISKYYYGFKNLKRINNPKQITELLYYSTENMLPVDQSGACLIEEPFAQRLFDDTPADVIEQEELAQVFDKADKEKIRKELLALKPNDSEIVYSRGKTYKRDNKTIAQLKILRNFQCQLCDVKILKKDGSFYVEAAHIIPKRKKRERNSRKHSYPLSESS